MTSLIQFNCSGLNTQQVSRFALAIGIAACHILIVSNALAATESEMVRSTAPGSAEAPPSLKRMSLEELMQVQVATVSTASKREEKATQAPGTVIVIDKNEIRLRGYSSLKDVLRDLPG